MATLVMGGGDTSRLAPGLHHIAGLSLASGELVAFDTVARTMFLTPEGGEPQATTVVFNAPSEHAMTRMLHGFYGSPCRRFEVGGHTVRSARRFSAAVVDFVSL